MSFEEKFIHENISPVTDLLNSLMPVIQLKRLYCSGYYNVGLTVEISFSNRFY